MTVGRVRLKEHEYDFPLYRPPSEARSLLVRVTRGCTWNKCTFCSMYKHLRFQRRPLEDILRDIAWAEQCCRDDVETVFIGDSNSLVIKTTDILTVLNRLYRSFPGLTRVTTYARAKTLYKKPFDDLLRIRRAGLNRLHVGLETGNAALLKKIYKGATPETFIEAGRKVKEAGFELSLYVLLGLGGEEHWQAHARDTAAVLNEIDPHFIRIRTLQPQIGSEIYADLQTGVFTKATPETVLQEQRLLLENLTVTSHYLSDHITNYVPVNGTLPVEKASLLAVLDEAIGDLPGNTALQQQFSRKDQLKSL